MSIQKLRSTYSGSPKEIKTKLNEVIEEVNDVAIGGDITSDTVVTTGVITSGGKLTGSVGLSLETANVTEHTVLATLTATQIVGTAAGDIGHTDGAILVAAPSSAYALEFVSAVLIFDYATAAYTGGADDCAIRVGSTAVSTAITDTNCIKATGDKVFRLGAIDTEISLGVGSTINFAGTAFTQPGTAAGVLRAYVTYRQYTTGL